MNIHRSSRTSAPIRSVLVVSCALAGAGAAYLRAVATNFTPEAASLNFTRAFTSGDFDEASALSSPSLVSQVVEGLCEPRYEAAKRVYDELIPMLAEPQWRTLRLKAETYAKTEWDALQGRIDSLGRQALADLGDEQQEALLADAAMFKEFVFCNGWLALGDEEKRKAGPQGALRQRAASEEFVLRIGWEALSEDERADLVIPSALGRGNSPEKLAYYDLIGRPLLQPEFEDVVVARAREATSGRTFPSNWTLEDCRLAEIEPAPIPARPAQPERRERQAVSPDYSLRIGGIKRADVRSLEAFASTHGREIAREVLDRTAFSDARAAPVVYPLRELGSVFVRGTAIAGVHIAVAGTPSALRFDVVKAGPGWRVKSMEGFPVSLLAGG